MFVNARFVLGFTANNRTKKYTVKNIVKRILVLYTCPCIGYFCNTFQYLLGKLKK